VAWGSARRGVYGGNKSLWALSHTSAVDHGLRNRYFAERGLVSLVGLHRRTHQEIVAPAQQQLTLELG
jgi:RNA-directed DNA polymerase